MEPSGYPIKQVLVFCNSVRGRSLENAIEILFRDASESDGSDGNIDIFQAIRGAEPQTWTSPVIAMKRRSLGADGSFYQDMGMVDYRDTVDYLTSYHHNEVAEKADGSSGRATVKASRSAAVVIRRHLERKSTLWSMSQKTILCSASQ